MYNKYRFFDGVTSLIIVYIHGNFFSNDIKKVFNQTSLTELFKMCTSENEYFNCRMDFLFKSDERHDVILKKSALQN